MPTDSASSDPNESINVEDQAQVKRWMERLGVTHEQLLEAVRAAGSRASDVTEHLLNQGASSGGS